MRLPTDKLKTTSDRLDWDQRWWRLMQLGALTAAEYWQAVERMERDDPRYRARR